jgi:hypothetical protein
MALKTYGPMAVDWENRIDFDRLRRERLARAKALLAKSEMGALLCFDMNNIRCSASSPIELPLAWRALAPWHSASTRRHVSRNGSR